MAKVKPVPFPEVSNVKNVEKQFIIKIIDFIPVNYEFIDFISVNVSTKLFVKGIC